MRLFNLSRYGAALFAVIGLNTSFANDRLFQCTKNSVEYFVGQVSSEKVNKWCSELTKNQIISNVKSVKRDLPNLKKSDASIFKFDDNSRREILLQELSKEQSLLAKYLALPNNAENTQIINRHKRNLDSIKAEIDRM